MLSLYDLPPVAPSILACIAADTTAQDDPFDGEGPASAPTVLVAADELVNPTALPAPPPMPRITGSEDWRPPPPSRLPIIRPALELVRPPLPLSKRPTVRVPELRSHEHQRAIRPSTPPTVPPPPSTMRSAA